MANLTASHGEADHLSAAWRGAKALDFVQRLKDLGLGAHSGAATLLQQLQVATNALDTLQQEQQETSRPWWADGDYDDSQAECELKSGMVSRANDQAMLMYAKKKYGAAFELWSRAIRLCPRKAVHHCNRAAAALKLRQYVTAAEDARQAIKRDPASVKAFLRAGHAHLGLHAPCQAAERFQQALQLDSRSAAAKRGRIVALDMQEQQGKAPAQQAHVLSEQRPAIPRQPVLKESQLGEMAYNAEAMLKSQPELEAAKCCCVEALIACRRYEDAAVKAEGLTAGIDKLYLQGEICWRQGTLEASLTHLQQACEISPNSSKCCDLQKWLLALQHRCHSVQLALEDGRSSECVQMCTCLLAEVQPQGCSGLYAHLLHQQAQAEMQWRQYDTALRCLDEALAWDPQHADCLWTKALACREAGLYTDSFMALQKLGKIAPTSPGLLEHMQKAAELCLGSGRFQGKQAQGSECNQAFNNADGSLLSMLGLTPTASLADLRRAYKQLAAKWHPDKWSSSSKADQSDASAKFVDVATAYRMLTDRLM